MNKYNIEGNISFYDELYKSLDDDVGQDAENEEICLITNMPLTDTHFKMQCGHKFNYKPLFLDIKNHKQKFNVMEGSGSKLGQHQIRCPYCRSKHTGTLPYYQEFHLASLHLPEDKSIWPSLQAIAIKNELHKEFWQQI